MPSARFSFSCDTREDIDVIQTLNEYSPRERGLVIKKAIRMFRRSQETDRLEVIEDKLAQLLIEVCQIRKTGVTITDNGSVPIGTDNTSRLATEEEVEDIKGSLRAMLEANVE